LSLNLYRSIESDPIDFLSEVLTVDAGTYLKLEGYSPTVGIDMIIVHAEPFLIGQHGGVFSNLPVRSPKFDYKVIVGMNTGGDIILNAGQPISDNGFRWKVYFKPSPNIHGAAIGNEIRVYSLGVNDAYR